MGARGEGACALLPRGTDALLRWKRLHADSVARSRQPIALASGTACAAGLAGGRGMGGCAWSRWTWVAF